MKYEVNGNMYEWVRMDNSNGQKTSFEWDTNFEDKNAVFVDFDENNWEFGTDGLLSTVYVMRKNIVREHKVYHNKYGAYIKQSGKRYYVLERCWQL